MTDSTGIRAVGPAGYEGAMTSGPRPLLVASNRGPLTVVAVEDGDDEVRRGGGGLVSGMQSALRPTPDAVWVCAAMNDRERALARQAPDGRLGDLDVAAEALHGRFRRADAADRRA